MLSPFLYCSNGARRCTFNEGHSEDLLKGVGESRIDSRALCALRDGVVHSGMAET